MLQFCCLKLNWLQNYLWQMNSIWSVHWIEKPIAFINASLQSLFSFWFTCKTPAWITTAKIFVANLVYTFNRNPYIILQFTFYFFKTPVLGNRWFLIPVVFHFLMHSCVRNVWFYEPHVRHGNIFIMDRKKQIELLHLFFLYQQCKISDLI